MRNDTDASKMQTMSDGGDILFTSETTETFTQIDILANRWVRTVDSNGERYIPPHRIKEITPA